MKKIFLVAIAIFAFAFTSNAQEFKVGANAALPIGDAGDFYSFSVGLDVAYLWNVSEKFDVGVASGFTSAFGDERSVTVLGITATADVDDAQFIPLAAAGRFNVSDKFYLGADLGYAIGINDGNDGGFYYRPRIGYDITEKINLNASYTAISIDGGDFNTIGLGVEFGL